jgi:hypothetical protein
VLREIRPYEKSLCAALRRGFFEPVFGFLTKSGCVTGNYFQANAIRNKNSPFVTDLTIQIWASRRN